MIPTGEGMGDQSNCCLLPWEMGFTWAANVAKPTHATPHEHHSWIHVLILGHTPQPKTRLTHLWAISMLTML